MSIFTKTLFTSVDTNRFDLSHDVKLSFSMGELIPTTVLECIPGDNVAINIENMLRFAPLISPVMHRVKVTTHFFFVPHRLTWPEWQKWITGESDVEAPYINLELEGGVVEGGIADYLGIPPGTYEDLEIKASPMAYAAYLLIWDEYYRDQNLQTEKFIPLVPGSNETNYGDLRSDPPLNRAWQHDYFTSCLPFAQKGDAVQLPLTSELDIPVELNPTTGIKQIVKLAGTHGNAGGLTLRSENATPSVLEGNTGDDLVIDPNGSLVVDVQAGATDINTLRRAFRLQEWLEKNARGGTRYVENILSHFGVKSSDARLQRPEYIGGAKQNMVISEVLSTAENTDASIPVGQMAGHGISVGGGNTFKYRCEEHGYIIGLINVQPETAYQDGLHRHFTRFDRLDYAWPTFANIGEQEVLLKEIQAQPSVGGPDSIFGYIPRYSEYKFMNSRVAGEMRSSLAFWHLGRQFQANLAPPALNEEFIECRPSTRIFAVTDPNEDHIFAHVFNNISAVRKLPKYGIPTI